MPEPFGTFDAAAEWQDQWQVSLDQLAEDFTGAAHHAEELLGEYDAVFAALNTYFGDEPMLDDVRQLHAS